MRKRKYPSEINTRLVRVSAGDYAMLAELSQNQGVTMAEAFRLMLEHREAETRASAVSPTQMSLIFQAKTVSSGNGNAIPKPLEIFPPRSVSSGNGSPSIFKAKEVRNGN